ncbi:MAG: aminopeptidase P N-terminal domain-containing protein [Terriglobia bacterium]
MRQRGFAIVFLLGLLVLVLPSGARDNEPLSEYAARRARLLERARSPVVLFGYLGREDVSPETTFRQEENFYYLTGHQEPGAAVLLVPQTAAARAAKLPKDTLFLPPRDNRRERWEGIKLGPDDPDVREKTGFARVKPFSALRADLERLLEIFPNLYTLFPRSGPNSAATHAGRWLAWLRTVAPAAGLHDVRGALGTMRQVKSESELKRLRVAIARSIEAHRAAMAALRPGMYEYEVAALMEYTFVRAGCERPGYVPIVGSGFNSTVLHSTTKRRPMQAGDVVVIDVGAECAGYTADITRTLPVSGTFTPRQREIYQLVLGAQDKAIAAVKPGMTLARTGKNSLYRIAYDYINTYGQRRNGEPLGKYFIHGIGHHVGLAVHDAGDPARPLEPGMVITIEPGIYIPEENLGVRIEDIVRVTEDGAELLTSSLPRSAKEIERLMAEAPIQAGTRKTKSENRN